MPQMSEWIRKQQSIFHLLLNFFTSWQPLLKQSQQIWKKSNVLQEDLCSTYCAGRRDANIGVLYNLHFFWEVHHHHSRAMGTFFAFGFKRLMSHWRILCVNVRPAIRVHEALLILRMMWLAIFWVLWSCSGKVEQKSEEVQESKVCQIL